MAINVSLRYCDSSKTHKKDVPDKIYVPEKYKFSYTNELHLCTVRTHMYYVTTTHTT